MFRRLGTTFAALILLSTLSACSPVCGSGADSGEEAVAGLISAARDSDDPAQLCRYVANGYTVSDSDLADLRDRYADHPDDELVLRQSEQLGSTAEVVVTDGVFTDVFFVTSDSDSRWTVAVGTLFG
jgi:hypothetical protein